VNTVRPGPRPKLTAFGDLCLIREATVFRMLDIIIIIINLFARNQNIHNNHRVYMMAGRQKN